jgi:VIT1/CCC1 family predicted Fe2+/Mn2+ transporter
MKESILTGLCFGLTSAVITTLGLMIGLDGFSDSKLVIVGGILTIAIADAFSDSLGIHISEESENIHTKKEIWESTLATFISKFFFALTFIIPILFLELQTAIIVNVIYGMIILALLSVVIAKITDEKMWMVVGEHLGIALTVVVISHYLGDLISILFMD